MKMIFMIMLFLLSSAYAEETTKKDVGFSNHYDLGVVFIASDNSPIAESILDLSLGYWGKPTAPLAVRLSGLFWGANQWHTELDLGLIFHQNESVRQFLGFGIRLGVENFRVRQDSRIITAIGPTYGLAWKFLYTQLGLYGFQTDYIYDSSGVLLRSQFGFRYEW